MSQSKRPKMSILSTLTITINITITITITITIAIIIIKIAISSLVIGLKKSCFPLIRLPSCYRTVC